jgi:membrane protein required for colicin V production
MASGASFNINTFDAIVVSVVGLSAMVAFFRGFVRELLSLGAWVGAAIVTVYLFPHSTEFMKSHIHGAKSEPVAAGAGALGTYLAALIAFSIVNSIILKYLKTGAEVGILDNFMGLVFGGLRGAFIVSLGYLIMVSVIPKDNPPEWLKKSLTKNTVEAGADFLAKMAPTYLHDLEGFVKKEEENAKKERDGKEPQEGDGTPQDTSSGFNKIIHQAFPTEPATPDNKDNNGTN